MDLVAPLLNAVAAPAEIRDRRGRTLHRNPELRSLLASEPERDRVEAVLEAVAVGLAAALGNGRATGPIRRRGEADGTLEHVETARGLYGAVGRVVRWTGDARSRAAPVMILTLRGPELHQPSADEIAASTRLTRREAEVALLLSRRRTNAEVARALVISPHTARHHTERVLRKLGLRSRRDVREALQRLPDRRGRKATGLEP